MASHYWILERRCYMQNLTKLFIIPIGVIIINVERNYYTVWFNRSLKPLDLELYGVIYLCLTRYKLVYEAKTLDM